MKEWTRLLIAAGLVGCAMSPNLSTLKTRAAFDMKCPESSLQLTKLSPEVYGVSGCDQRATYVNSPRSWDDWMLNSQADPAAAPAAPNAADGGGR
jgi:hypothetical protein